ncbi:MAG: amidohydrolase family protein [Planctomycetota bacterium]
MRFATLSNIFKAAGALFALLAMPVLGMAAGPLAIQNAKIITVSGDTIEKGTILIRDGVIEAVGTDVKVPGEALVIDGEGKVVMPGLIDAHNAAGMSQANEQNSVVPFLSVVDSIDPIATYFEECRRNGITSAAVVPGNSTLIGGKAAIVKTAGQYVNDMLVRRDSALKISLRPVSGSRMSHLARLRKELDKAKKALEKEEEGEKKDDEKSKEPEKKEADSKDAKPGEEKKEESSDEKKPAAPTAADEGMKALKAVVQGKMPVYIYCAEAMDVPAAMTLIKEYNLKPIFVLGRNCHKASKMLAAKGQTVILDPTLVYWETNPRTREDEKIVIPEIYHAAKVPYIFQVSSSSSSGTDGSSYFWYQAATAVKYGASEKDALAALTLEPAKLLGIDKMVGSIEEGKEADLVILTGDPLEITTWVEHTIVGGEVVYDRSEDEKLERLLAPKAE